MKLIIALPDGPIFFIDAEGPLRPVNEVFDADPITDRWGTVSLLMTRYREYMKAYPTDCRLLSVHPGKNYPAKLWRIAQNLLQ
jgi:hypothetical protein